VPLKRLLYEHLQREAPAIYDLPDLHTLLNSKSEARNPNFPVVSPSRPAQFSIPVTVAEAVQIAPCAGR